MLVLGRKQGERLLIGSDICITIVRLTPDGVKIGIDAPKGITILREELALKNASQCQPLTDPRSQPEETPVRDGLGD
jgi:carbon storage regulator